VDAAPLDQACGLTQLVQVDAGNPEAERKTGGIGLWAFWLMVAGITGMTMAFGAAVIGQVCLERILGIGYLDTQLMLHVHFQMLLFAAVVS
jgi:nitric oxide reductase subunit B